jgi:hypothetical protein
MILRARQDRQIPELTKYNSTTFHGLSLDYYLYVFFDPFNIQINVYCILTATEYEQVLSTQSRNFEIKNSGSITG